jgi:redox-sensitive bicupin YhaK (pirin superfamily)
MIILRKANDRGHADHGWLNSWHSFSFADYHDPAHMGVGNLRVSNDDRIAPGTGSGSHGHRDMEIVSYVLEGALAHRDSMGNGDPAHGGGADGVVRPGDVQRMSAGTGVMHSEFNHDKSGQTHFLQIWIQPRRLGLEPGYEQKHFSPEAKRGRLALVASPDGAEGSVTIHADASIRVGLFDGDESLDQPLDSKRQAYVHVARGTVEVNGQPLSAGDALTLRDEPRLRIAGGRDAEVLVFDLTR